MKTKKDLITAVLNDRTLTISQIEKKIGSISIAYDLDFNEELIAEYIGQFTTDPKKIKLKVKSILKLANN